MSHQNKLDELDQMSKTDKVTDVSNPDGRIDVREYQHPS
jgi:hypothetical protein